MPARTNDVHAAALAPSDAMGAYYAGTASAATLVAIALSTSSSLALWLAGQLLLAFALLQWFIVLHEAGHRTLFRTRALNALAGHVAGFMALIPFACWRRVHGLHHLWTGWQDKDPTTVGLAPRARGWLEIKLVDLAWRLWLPLFSVLYRLGNYWHLPRLRRLFPSRRQQGALMLNAAVLLALYASVVALLGAETSVRLFAAAIAISFVLQDPLILSQHTHMPQRLSAGAAVAPLPAHEQMRHTRSLLFPHWFAQWLLLNFNAHELHHRHAAVPGYRLSRIAAAPDNAVHWWTWLRAAKRVRGSVFLFQTRKETGLPL